MFMCLLESALDSDVGRSGGDNVHLDVTVDKQDNDIRSETGASIDNGDIDKETQLGENSGDASNETDTVTQGTHMCHLILRYTENLYKSSWCTSDYVRVRSCCCRTVCLSVCQT